MGTIATVVLDDVDVTELAVSGTVTRQLNRVGLASVRFPAVKLTELYGTTVPNAGSYLKVYFENDTLGTTPVLWHHGRVMSREITGDRNAIYVEFNSADPLELWQWRPVRDDDGDFSLPEIIQTYEFAPQIVQAMFNNSVDTTLGGGGPPPTDAEGPLRMRLNSVAGGTKTMIGAPTDWPMTMAELATLLVSTGLLDIVVTPIEFDAFDNYGQLDLYNGDFGNDLTGSVSLDYGVADDEISAFRWMTDMTSMCNKLWYYLGPRKKTGGDPAGNQHWEANITGDDPGLAYPPGGALSPPASAANNQIGVARYASQQTYDVRMDIKIFDALGDEAVVARDLYRRLWQIESFLRANPQTIIHVTPTRDTGIGEFDIGDLVLCEAVANVRGGFSGAQRVYAYTASWDTDSVVEIGELQVSSDQEGFDA